MLGISISYNPKTGEVELALGDNQKEYRKRNKGESLLAFKGFLLKLLKSELICQRNKSLLWIG
ncbi:MAG: hypothetical protein PHZ11_10770 [Desulfitobacteriaceae bacterium]|nr:hypothetical protein [Desulfitobacteriaceae bacterium]